MPEIQEQESVNDQINNRLQEDAEPAGLASAYTGQGHDYKKKPVVESKEFKEAQELGQKIADVVMGNTKKKQVRKKMTKPATKTTTADAINKLQDKVLSLQFIDSIGADGEVPQVQKDMRELLLAYLKEVEKVKTTFVEKIQKH